MDGFYLYIIRGHSKTTWIRFWPFLTTYLPQLGNCKPKLGLKEAFLTTYPPHLVIIVFKFNFKNSYLNENYKNKINSENQNAFLEITSDHCVPMSNVTMIMRFSIGYVKVTEIFDCEIEYWSPTLRLDPGWRRRKKVTFQIQEFWRKSKKYVDFNFKYHVVASSNARY